MKKNKGTSSCVNEPCDLTLRLSTHKGTHSLEFSSDSVGDEPQLSYQGSTLVTSISHKPSYFPLELLEIIV
jgi:hypothetical protein